jgi:hypothetical protein
MRMCIRTAWSAVLCLLLLQAARAQSVVTGELSGTVTDPSGAVVANAKIALKSDATGETATDTSGGFGQFRFALLRPGIYTLTVTAAGFSPHESKATVNSDFRPPGIRS